MDIIWTDRADELKNEIADYILVNFGYKARKNFLTEVYETVLLLATNPFMGKIEPILEDRPQTYRSLVINHINKVVYRAEDDRIVVVAIWDCRRAPETLAGQID